MEVIQLDKEFNPKFLGEVEKRSGQNISACYQCGKCTAGCPAGDFYDVQISRIMRAVQLGLKDEALGCRSLWLCLSCSTCTQRCPNEIDIARVVETLRGMAREEGKIQDRPIEKFWQSFLDVVKRTGRSYELGVMAEFMLRSGRGWGNVDMAPTALRRRKLPMRPTMIKGREEVARILRRFAEKRSA